MKLVPTAPKPRRDAWQKRSRFTSFKVTPQNVLGGGGNLGSETWQQIYERLDFRAHRPLLPERSYKPPLPSHPKGVLNMVGSIWDLIGLGPVIYHARQTATEMS